MAQVTLTSAVAGSVATAVFYNNNNNALLNQINGNLDATNLANLAVTTAKLASGAVTGPKIAMGLDAQGDILYYNGTQYARLGAGTSGYFLKTQGAGANPIWAAVDKPGFPDWANKVSKTAGTEYTALVDGWLAVTASTDGNNTASVSLHIGNATNTYQYEPIIHANSSGSNSGASSGLYPVKTGQFYKIDTGNPTSTIYFVPNL